MSVTVTQQLTQQTVTVTGNPVENNVTVTVSNARGASGAAGPNTITTSTTAPSLTGYIFGNGTTIAGATAATNDATASTLARRDSAGGCQFTDLSATVSFDAGTFSVDSSTGSTFEAGSSVTFNATAYTYGTGAASAHRIALGAGTTGATLFGAADAGAARTTLGLATTNSPTFAGITATTTHPNAAAITATQGIYSSFLGANNSAGSFIGCSVSGVGAGFANASASANSFFPCNASGALTNGVMNLGRADYRFNNYFGTNGNFSGALTIGGDATAMLNATLSRNGAGVLLLNSTNAAGVNIYGQLQFSNDNNADIGNVATNRPRNLYVGTGVFAANLTASGTITATGIATASNFKRGAGSPESVVTGIVGDIYTRTDGGAGTTLYVKESGTGNTGWAAK